MEYISRGFFVYLCAINYVVFCYIITSAVKWIDFIVLVYAVGTFRSPFSFFEADRFFVYTCVINLVFLHKFSIE